MSSIPQPPVTGLSQGSPRFHGRCWFCGYTLYEVSVPGVCPECGKAYDAISLNRLQPWPSALSVCCWLGWPVAGLVLTALPLVTGARGAGFSPFGLIFLFLLALPLNSYFQVRAMLKRSMPERQRTTGMVALLRGLGTSVCVVAVLFLFALPLIVMFFIAALCAKPSTTGS